jgi:tRNA nucleotidyltransferase (CCA-adding enzyme)
MRSAPAGRAGTRGAGGRSGRSAPTHYPPRVASRSPLPSFAAERVPAPVRELLAQLAAAGYRSVLVGGCVRDLAAGRPVRDFDVATPAPPERVLALFPNAIPIGLRHGTVMVPTPAGPVDVTRFRAGGRLEDDLARRDFTVNALAWSPDGSLVDRHGGLEDLAAGRLRAVGDADARMKEDPLRALRAARLLAEHGWRPDDDLVAAMARAAPALAGVAGERLRGEIERLLLGPFAGDGLRLLRRTNIEAELAPGASEQAAAMVDALPRRRDERLAAWLIGTPARRILARLRFSNATVARIARILREHPVDLRADPARPPSVRRLLHRLEPEDLDLSFRLATAAAATGGPSGASERVEALRRAIREQRANTGLALRRADLALDGAEVMNVLGVGPGPEIGDALRYLTDCVLEDPAENEPARLRARLEAWARARR